MNSLNNEALWSDDERNVIYSFGGNINGTDYKHSSDSIQSFIPNGKGGGEWTEVLGFVGQKHFPSDIHGVTEGKFTSDTNEAYYFGGIIGPGTSPSSSKDAYSNNDLLTLNFEDLTFTNSSNGNLSDPLKPSGIYGDVLLNVPIYGSQGVLLNFGGNNDSFIAGFNSINIFDKKENKWYYQIADGDIPRPRIYFCAVGVYEKNHTSFEM